MTRRPSTGDGIDSIEMPCKEPSIELCCGNTKVTTRKREQRLLNRRECVEHLKAGRLMAVCKTD
ncbi:MAG: hypothetical protein QOE85_575 [Actinomycetota bacterium]|nr:hypothetical protein [Actinomycetota bacterium]